tara:strand:+ start:556 stop:723 length:168 start_codon:yes stop_codon:yes gene_type:complete
MGLWRGVWASHFSRQTRKKFGRISFWFGFGLLGAINRISFWFGFGLLGAIKKYDR